MGDKADPQISSLCSPLFLCLDETAGKLNPTSAACHGQPFHTNIPLLFHDIPDKRRSTPFNYDSSPCLSITGRECLYKTTYEENTTLKRERRFCLCTSDVVKSVYVLASYSRDYNNLARW